MFRIVIAVLFASASLAGSASAHDALLHDSTTAVRDVEHVHHDEQDVSRVERDLADVEHGAHDVTEADHETATLVHDAMHDDGLLHDDKPSEDDRAREDDKRAHEAEKIECDRLEFEYYLRHPPGTKPEGLSGLHGCALYRADAHYHDTHPNVVSVLGDNIDLMP